MYKVCQWAKPNGSYWCSGNDLSHADNRKRKQMLAEKVPYRLRIVTDSYAGNFERELVAFAVGRLDSVQESIGYAADYIKAFWNFTEGEGVNSYEEYLGLPEKHFSETAASALEKVELLEKAQYGNISLVKDICQMVKEAGKTTEDRYTRFYKNVLCETYKVVDDWEQYTFYGIEGSRHGNCKAPEMNCVYIQLQDASLGEMEETVIRRIHSFFEENVYELFSSYEAICSFGADISRLSGTMRPKLLHLELMDGENIVTDYSDWKGIGQE